MFTLPLQQWDSGLAEVRRILDIDVRARSTQGGAIHFCLKIYVSQINKMPEFCMIIARKIIFAIFFFGGGGHVRLWFWGGM